MDENEISKAHGDHDAADNDDDLHEEIHPLVKEKSLIVFRLIWSVISVWKSLRRHDEKTSSYVMLFFFYSPIVSVVLITS